MKALDTPRVLVVDDDGAVRTLIKAVLDDAGCATETAEHGAAGLSLLQECRFDVAVVDIGMPVMDGLTFYRELQQRGLVLPTLLLSAERDLPHIARELGVDGWLSKPFDPDALVGSVLELHHRRRLAYDDDPLSEQ